MTTTSEVAAAPPPVGRAMEHVIPTRNQPALLGYYCAIFGLLPLAGLILAPAAICYGLVGLERGVRLPRNIGYGHALFATVAGIIGAIFNYALVLALAITLTFNYLNATWPFLPERTLHEIIDDQQRQIDELQKQLDLIPKAPARPGGNAHLPS